MHCFIFVLNTRKIINDPVYGFISIPEGIIFKLIEHPYFQRLRYIRQSGLTHLVYPGSIHTRFHHALGAMHLMGLAIETLRNKGHQVSEAEEEAVHIAILLHDIGHGPFSHALESTIVKDISHEDISAMLMERLNTELDGGLSMAIDIFNDTYPRRFLHQLVSGQLDMDRLDYLNRDSFFTGVTEGLVGSDRIIKMLNLYEGQIVVEEKGIYSVEKFLIARRLMYWQVYLHKTVIAAEQTLNKILVRARELALAGKQLFCTPALCHFLYNTISREEFDNEPKHLEIFAKLDDTDIMSAIKVWVDCDDVVLSRLCSNLINRHLFHVDISPWPPDHALVDALTQKAIALPGVGQENAHFLVFTDSVLNDAYKVNDTNIRILMKDGTVSDITAASDNANLAALAKTVTKYILCYDKQLI